MMSFPIFNLRYSTAGGDFLLGKTQHAGKDISFHGKSVDSRHILPGKIAKNVARRHFKKEIAAQFPGNGGCIVPADTMSDIVREITRNELRGAHGPRVHVADVGHLWLSQSQGRETVLQQVGYRLQQGAVRRNGHLEPLDLPGALAASLLKRTLHSRI